MTHKDYRLIASVLKNSELNDSFWALCLCFSVRLAQDNPRFDAKRFAIAAGVPAELLERFLQAFASMMRKGN